MPQTNTPQANVSAITKNRCRVLVAVKILPRAIKKPRQKSEASRHTLSRGECQLRPVRVGSLTFVYSENPPGAVSKSLPPGTLQKTSVIPSDSRLQWRDRGRFSRPSLKIEIRPQQFQFLPASTLSRPQGYPEPAKLSSASVSAHAFAVNELAKWHDVATGIVPNRGHTNLVVELAAVRNGGNSANSSASRARPCIPISSRTTCRIEDTAIGSAKFQQGCIQETTPGKPEVLVTSTAGQRMDSSRI